METAVPDPIRYVPRPFAVHPGCPILRALQVAILRAFQPLNPWCTGEDSNLRSSKERQIYSLLPLTARPPVPNHPSDEDLSPGTLPAPSVNPLPGALSNASHSAHQAPPGEPPAIRSMHLSGIAAEDRPGAQNTSCTGQFFLTVSDSVSRFLQVELAKGFEPPTL